MNQLESPAPEGRSISQDGFLTVSVHTSNDDSQINTATEAGTIEQIICLPMVIEKETTKGTTAKVHYYCCCCCFDGKKGNLENECMLLSAVAVTVKMPVDLDKNCVPCVTKASSSLAV